MKNLPDTQTPAKELTREQIKHMETRLPSVSVVFVERNIPDALVLAKHYRKRRDDYLYFAPVKGEGYVFDPKLYAKAVNAFDVLMEHIPAEHVPEWWATRRKELA